eukprot:g1804.t1
MVAEKEEDDLVIKTTPLAFQEKRKKQRLMKRSDGKFPCREWDEKGTCKWSEDGKECRFSHLGPNDPGMPEGVEHVRTRKRKATCFNFQSGSCIYGKRCRYKHKLMTKDESKLQKRLAEIAAGSDRICHDFKRGDCSRGDNCKFSHNTNVFAATQLKDDEGNIQDPQAAKLARIMALPISKREKQKARAIFFQKQKKGYHMNLFQKPSNIRMKKGIKKDGKFSGLCFAFNETGTCSRGENCIFQHVKDLEAVGKAKERIEKVKAKKLAKTEKEMPVEQV